MSSQAQRPDVPNGYLGPQTKFGEFGLSALSHDNAEFSVTDNVLEIKLKTSRPVKVTSQLIQAFTEKDLSEYVFTNTQGNVVSLLISFPESSYYKLQIYALPLDDDSKTLPGVYNYLVNVKRALTAVYPYPKQYAQWKEGCFLHEPLVLHKGCRLSNVHFRVVIPKAKAVAVVVDGEWTPLKEGKDGIWQEKVPLDQYRGKDTKITLNANFVADETKYSTLLEYKL